MQGCASETELRQYREMFRLLDAEGRGTIAVSSLHHMLGLLHLTPSVDVLEDVLGADGDGAVSFAQFVVVVSRCVQSEFTPEQLRNAFRVFETDTVPSGHVAVDVLLHALTSYGSHPMTYDEAAQLVATVTTDASAYINYVDFVAALTGSS